MTRPETMPRVVRPYSIIVKMYSMRFKIEYA
jgi:hypothetical protein